MIQVLATNITSPLGLNTEQNYSAVRAGRSALMCRSEWRGVPEPFTASMFTDEQIATIEQTGCTRFESLAIYSILDALRQTDVDIHSPRTLLIMSTTKADIDALSCGTNDDYHAPGATAQKIAYSLGMSSRPIVVCNACISGVTALVMAHRLISAGTYDHAVVCGVDCVTPFTLAGFMSFKALSPYECRPFDIERLGLNLGEAAATIVYGCQSTKQGWGITRACLNNDAYHISAPSPTGEGVFRAIQQVMAGISPDELATVCVHGTATMFNDQMESMAIQRAGLSDVPAFALKGYYGHTMGAAGLLETILTMRSLDDGIIPATRGYEEIGVSGRLSISNAEHQTDKTTFLKIISGFGGCNGAMVMSKRSEESVASIAVDVEESHVLHMDTGSLSIDGQIVPTTSAGKSMLTEIYKTHIGNYPKFYKMDLLSRVVLIATEMLVRQEDAGNSDLTDRAILLFNASSSIVADRNHIATYSQNEGFYPSPSVFVYTLPNIVTGEVAIKHQYQGETTLVILANKDKRIMQEVVDATLSTGSVRTLLTGWVDCPDEDHFDAELRILNKKTKL